MKNETLVTRGGQITLTKEIRERTSIGEGDRVILNTMGEIIMISKKNPKVFDDVKSFLPENFEKILVKIRTDEKERMKRLGILG
ncbi:MAG TPA: AbrB/MazE/SpoVT family DNA-binding domain-containing protein [Candidatus Nanoarchaeia archaeon]|nr:AbrB/MazE/SpoVT family DNA-binding domain-containing protein [Candidatus Nanoarchaeia archaeon]